MNPSMGSGRSAILAAAAMVAASVAASSDTGEALADISRRGGEYIPAPPRAPRRSRISRLRARIEPPKKRGPTRKSRRRAQKLARRRNRGR